MAINAELPQEKERGGQKEKEMKTEPDKKPRKNVKKEVPFNNKLNNNGKIIDILPIRCDKRDK